jgi:hypothetical protein
LNWHVLNTSLKSILRGSEGSLPASVTSNEDPRDHIFAGVDTNCNWNQEDVSMDAPLDHRPQYTGTHTTLDLLAPSTFPGLHHPQAIAQCQEQTASREMTQQSQISGKGPTAESPKSPPRPDKKHRAPDRRYWCSCGKGFTQEQGRTRHQLEISLCTYCGDFKWRRRYQWKKHLQEQHPDVDLSVLDEITRSRRKATKIKKRPTTTRGFSS